jgi:hypothetical protein
MDSELGIVKVWVLLLVMSYKMITRLPFTKPFLKERNFVNSNIKVHYPLCNSMLNFGSKNSNV